MSAVITLKDISKTYGVGDTSVQALKKTNLSFFNQEFVGIMGKSGSGKSTLLNILGMLDHPSTGEYILDNQNISDHSDDRISYIRSVSIGFIFQSFNLFARQTILENVITPMRYAGTKSKSEMIETATHLLDKLGLADRLKHRPSELSGGQCQRVAIARSLANNPPVLLADEPTGNLDEKTGNEVIDIFHELKANGQLIIMVTHNPEYENIVDRMIHLSDGHVVSK
ncbi:MAG: ABC transporter ATP-binding protein [Lentisphaeraceae bacterium]|nr:ABC transporter ATP-binding protein [Lentisphaeraceae bacterium]